MVYDGLKAAKDAGIHQIPELHSFLLDYYGGAGYLPHEGSMQQRYANVRRISSLRHFADEADEISDDDLLAASEWLDKQPKGLGDQVNTGVAPPSEVQVPNPVAGQDVTAGRAPANLYEAQLWAQADSDYYDDETLGQDPYDWVDENRDFEEEAYNANTVHDWAEVDDDPWNGHENPLGRGWGDPPVGY